MSFAADSWVQSAVSADDYRSYVLSVLASESGQNIRTINKLPLNMALTGIAGVTPLASLKIMIRLRLAFGAQFPEQAYALPDTLGDLLQVVIPHDARQ